MGLGISLGMLIVETIGVLVVKKEGHNCMV